MESNLNEKQLLHDISTLTNQAKSLSSGIERVKRLLEQDAGLHSLFVESFDDRSADEIGIRPAELEPFFELPKLPYKFVYSVGLRADGRDHGRLVLAFGYKTFPGDTPRRIATFAGEQLGLLAARTRLAETRASRARQLDDLKQRLTTDKVLARAHGLLTGRYRFSEPAARQWIAAQSRKTGSTEVEVAERLIHLHTAPLPNLPGLRPGLPRLERLSA